MNWRFEKNWLPFSSDMYKYTQAYYLFSAIEKSLKFKQLFTIHVYVSLFLILKQS